MEGGGPMQLRVLKRLTSLELEPSGLMRVEFWSKQADQPDLRVSTYLVADAEITQVISEHAASFLAPPRCVGALAVDAAAGPMRCVASPGTTRFSFANGRHHELCFDGEAQLLAFARQLCGPPATEPVERERKELLHYARSRLAEGDPEWVSGLQAAPKGAAWLNAIRPGA